MEVARNIDVEFLRKPESQVEIVERKGLGHPDSLCDGIVEEISCRLSEEYLKEVGFILHHNVDKMLIAAGEADVDFGGGKITKPIFLDLAGRAIAKYGGKEFDVHGIAIQTAKDYLKKTCRNLDVENDVKIMCNIGRGSADLVDGFSRKSKKSSNDTSFGTGYAPFSTLEKTVLDLETHLNSDDVKRRVPAIGEDIKVMGLRQENDIKITVAVAYVAKHIAGLEAYKEAKAKTLEEAKKVVAKHEGDHKIEVMVNTLDDYDKPSVYITATGLSAENGDDGSVGRGNRVNGLITPMRPMSLEAAAGKNPVTHVGKIYNTASFRIARDIVAHYPEIRDCEVYLLSQIGKPISEPKVANVKIATANGSIDPVKSGVHDLVDRHLENISEITDLFVKREEKVF